MTRMSFENKVTMGNILTALAMLVAVVAAYSNLQAQQISLERQAVEIEKRVDEGEARTRALEQSTATSSARYESLAQAARELKGSQRHTNDLPRQLIKGGLR